MAYLPISTPGEVGGPDGYSYGALVLMTDAADAAALERVLRVIRFTGWIAPAASGTQIVVGDPGAGVVAAGRRGIIEVGAVVAEQLDCAVLAVRVRRDRQLGLVAWRGAEEIGRYDSDPSAEPGADDDVASELVGVAAAPGFAALAGVPTAGETLTEILDEELERDSVSESERLRGILRLLSLPDWIVASSSLPRDIPTGPRAADLIRLRGGMPGACGIWRGLALRRLRRRWTPPPIIADPPRESGQGLEGIEPWMF
ncbi:hypothetical protein QSU92_03540 [Microbacterium sp. ET2]|uniref:hypothetical protein n=1 Tax=Microbacterium albipurpureum TaxID=3050384 RepID=UPI00259C7902|nr:hypothetical protein [Microbacterium sp. ET2 (Ac-2212)]WJL96276.1 hypothetical protein QSU92_03540 [Microbacterium sp. ET2 (Ac-2212)]